MMYSRFGCGLRFPRLYAAASLKLQPGEARTALHGRFPRLYAAASLKLDAAGVRLDGAEVVFRGFMPRPH